MQFLFIFGFILDLLHSILLWMKFVVNFEQTYFATMQTIYASAMYTLIYSALAHFLFC